MVISRMNEYSFENLEVYKLAREYRKKIYKLTYQLPKEEQFNLISQMRKAAVSLTNNIAEGHGRYHYQENIQFLRHSRGSLEELLDDLNVCIDEKYADKDYIEGLKEEGYSLLKKLNSYIKYLKGKKTGTINNQINQLVNG
jgi:four helix bundle protein